MNDHRSGVDELADLSTFTGPGYLARGLHVHGVPPLSSSYRGYPPGPTVGSLCVDLATRVFSTCSNVATALPIGTAPTDLPAILGDMRVPKILPGRTSDRVAVFSANDRNITVSCHTIPSLLPYLPHNVYIATLFKIRQELLDRSRDT